jgi:hypothetical protein
VPIAIQGDRALSAAAPALGGRCLDEARFRGEYPAMSDRARILTIPRHNPINAFTMGGIADTANS